MFMQNYQLWWMLTMLFEKLDVLLENRLSENRLKIPKNTMLYRFTDINSLILNFSELYKISKSELIN